MNTAIITGASSGIGLETARLFLEHEYNVINLSRRPCPEKRVTSVEIDLSSPQLAFDLEQSLLPKVQGNSPQKIHLVHNAAKLLIDRAENTTDEELKEVVQINVLAPNTLNRLLIPVMDSGSSIVLVGSTLSEKAVANAFSYTTTKHALVGMMRALCQDLIGTKVHTCCICPGFTDTEMLRTRVPAEFMDGIVQMSAFERLIEPEEIAESIFWATQNPVINGSVIHANLGQRES